MPINQENFNKLGRYLENGHNLIRSIKTIAEDQMPPRRYKGEELVELVGARSNTIYMAEKEGRLPSPILIPKPIAVWARPLSKSWACRTISAPAPGVGRRKMRW